MYNIWNNILASIEQKVTSDKFALYFKDTSLLSNESGHIIIGVKNAFFKKQLSSKFYGIIEEAIKNNGINPIDISFEIQTDIKNKVRPREVITSAPTLVKDIKKSTRLNNTSHNLKPDYTLENCIVGSNNDLAVAAAKSIIDAPGKRFNPFFLYGGSGLGKTHLIQAIGNALLKNKPFMQMSFIKRAVLINNTNKI